MRESSILSLALGLLAPWASAVAAQEGQAAPPTRPPACGEAVHHAFDFWVGEWEVRLGDGSVAGHNTVRRMSDGCGLAERWRGVSGSIGESFNWADPVDGRWHQLWIDGSGLVLRLAGGPVESGMRLEGRGNDTTVLHRVTWTALDDGRVRQHWQISRDEGDAWSTLFEGFYSRVPTEATERVGAEVCDTPEGRRFDFWPGEWRVESRQRRPGGEWVETEGIWRAEAIVGGCGFLDFTVGDYGDGMMSGMGSRLYDPETDRWAVTWTSTQNPGKTGTWEGRFGDDGMGEFFRETETPNGTVHSRLRWMNIEGDSADWDYSISPDGVEWTILWEMTLRRLGRRPEGPMPIPTADSVTFPAADGEEVHGTWYRAPGKARAVVLAFHQGGASGGAEYGPIVPRLVERGLHVLATDQRAGGGLFGGRNRTVEARGHEAGFCDAAPDLAGALQRARSEYPGLPILLWGSSYSGALALRLAARNPPGVVGVLAFSPATGAAMTGCEGEAVSGGISVPVLALRGAHEMERDASRVQMDRLREHGHRVFIADPGAHGSSMLVEERVGADVGGSWRVVNDFIDRVLAGGDGPRAQGDGQAADRRLGPHPGTSLHARGPSSGRW